MVKSYSKDLKFLHNPIFIDNPEHIITITIATCIVITYNIPWNYIGISYIVYLAIAGRANLG